MGNKIDAHIIVLHFLNWGSKDKNNSYLVCRYDICQSHTGTASKINKLFYRKIHVQSLIFILYIQYFIKLILSLHITINEKKETTEKYGQKIIVLNSQRIFCVLRRKIYVHCTTYTANHWKRKFDSCSYTFSQLSTEGFGTFGDSTVQSPSFKGYEGLN